MHLQQNSRQELVQEEKKKKQERRDMREYKMSSLSDLKRTL